jgi:hypothetical protein
VRTVQLSIPKDSKLGDIVAGLNDPVEYVRNVLAALSQHGGAKNPDVQVRLSLQSGYTAPNYQIVEIMDAETGQPMDLAAYSGKTHKELPYNDKLALAHWSVVGSSFVEAQNLIGALRKAAKSS